MARAFPNKMNRDNLKNTLIFIFNLRNTTVLFVFENYSLPHVIRRYCPDFS